MSGFSYPEWIGEIYPKGTKRTAMLAEYANIFPAVEINMTFRRRPQATTLERWRDAVPDTFRFAMKANAGITHYRRLVGTAGEVAEFMTTASTLGGRLGPVLFQVPEKLMFDADVLATFCGELPTDGAYAFEPRSEEFMSDEARSILRRFGVALCLNDDTFGPATYEVTGPFAYFRFHREAPYAPDELEQRAAIVKGLSGSGVDVYAFFSHEDNPESVKPALRFLELLRAA
jgi:uncharacterized protein YecE (DUF72 family)